MGFSFSLAFLSYLRVHCLTRAILSTDWVFLWLIERWPGCIDSVVRYLVSRNTCIKLDVKRWLISLSPRPLVSPWKLYYTNNTAVYLLLLWKKL